VPLDGVRIDLTQGGRAADTAPAFRNLGQDAANSGSQPSQARCNGVSTDYIPPNFDRPVVAFFLSGANCMIVTPAYAQGAGAAPDMLISILPFVLIFVIMYFLIIRPQRTQLKKRSEMLAAIRRGDTVVTGGGFVGKVTKVIDDNELEIDLGGMKVTALRSTISDVRVKGEPVANQNVKK
jgi:preprotein translocase subunit YajC